MTNNRKTIKKEVTPEREEFGYSFDVNPDDMESTVNNGDAENESKRKKNNPKQLPSTN